ncbi:protein of unknown function DUF305 containing protein [Nitzschia inconspicua]|uniref:DUF305 domain-containing protein n=1 Tax=Nitzschia inconspicua TaxID=303405 RepID=A0A9K3Q792_9STRA|nr:protein of unknown function DUF305 containing protein [Nitzschia inconspicua]
MDLWNPTIAMEIGETYTFVQKDRTNYYHPIGIAYSPYGDQEVKIEAEPGISVGNQECIANHTCPAPMYYLNDEYLGKYSNIPGNETTGEDDFGLDVYEPLFMRSPAEWTSHGTFSIQLRIDDDSIKSDLFYFCHIHEFMGGRIKLTKNGKVLNELDTPDLGYEYDTLSEFDKECGTWGLGDFELPNPLCPERFVCNTDEASPELQQFSHCIDAMNCHMMAGMTTGVKKALDEAALFVHQMIPHHQNAVNMAKALLKTNKLHCEDLSNEDEPDCVLESILFDIVNTQNMQIQVMYDFWASKRLPEQDNCDVYVETLPEPSVFFESATSGGNNVAVYGWGTVLFLLVTFLR